MGLVVKFNENKKVWTWRARLYANGKQHERSGSERLKRDADEVGAEKLAQLKKELRNQNSKTITHRSTLEKLILEYISTKTLASNSKKAYNRALKNHIMPSIGSMAISDIDRIIYQKFINSLIDNEKKYAKATIELTHSLANGALEFAYRYLRIIDINPAVKIDINIDIPQDDLIKNDSNKYYTEKEIELMNSCADERVESEKLKRVDKSALRDILFFLPRSGARISEVLGLLEEDYNEADSTIVITKQLTDDSTAQTPVFGKPKSRDSYRIIYLDSETNRMIKKRILVNKKFRLQNPHLKNEFDFIFSIQNKHIYRSKFRYYMTIISRKSGVPYHDQHLIHGLRHSHTKQLHEAGISDIDVKKRLGHSKYSTATMSYMHTDDFNQRTTIDIYEKHISKEN